MENHKTLLTFYIKELVKKFHLLNFSHFTLTKKILCNLEQENIQKNWQQSKSLRFYFKRCVYCTIIISHFILFLMNERRVFVV